MSETETISVRMSVDEAVSARRAPGPGREPFGVGAGLFAARWAARRGAVLPEALLLLAKSARAGKVQAQVALERALRDHPRGNDFDDELSRLLDDE